MSTPPEYPKQPENPYGATPANPYDGPPPQAEGYPAPQAQAYPAPPAYPGGAPAAPTYQNGPSGKTRSPIGVFLLSIVTFGIYGIVWYYKVNVELKNYHPSIQVNPTNMILLYLFVPFFSLFSIYYTGQRIQQAQQLSGLPSTTSPGVGVLLAFLVGGQTFYYQDALNNVWQYRQA